MNEGSSRSHSVFFITITQVGPTTAPSCCVLLPSTDLSRRVVYHEPYQRDTATSSTKTSKLVLVDLAGSEMVRKTQVRGHSQTTLSGHDANSAGQD